MRCPTCAHENPDDARFCNSCGAVLQADAAGDGGRDPRDLTPAHLAEKIRAARGTGGERKQVTVLFADVMGSMELAERTDPEAWRGIMDRFFAILCEGVHRFEGTVDKFTGDGIMALFGAPIAHEDHAQRACYAALHLDGTLADYAAELRRSEGINLAVRIGINSGEVVVGEIGDDLSLSYTALGHTVGLAQRMEQLAEPGKTYLTPSTAALVESYVDLEDLGEFEVKGVTEPLRVYELAGAGDARSRFDVSRDRGFSRFVGRSDEMTALEEALEASGRSDGRVVGIVGEPGVGKSRLCHEFAQRCRGRGIPVYEARAQAHAKRVPLLPALQLTRAYFGITSEDSDRRAREKVAGRLLLLDPAFAEDLPVIFDFLAIPDPERPAPRMDPDARLRQLLSYSRRLVKGTSEREPGVNLIEDLHWIDAPSEVFLANLVEAVEGSKNLTILNFRPEYQADWMAAGHYRQIDLVPLGNEAIEELLDDLLGDDASLAPVREVVRQRTGGNPFFIEELVQSLVESGQLAGERGALRLDSELEDTAVPATVQAVLAARIDRLPKDQKTVLQTAAVIGKELPEPVLQSVADLEQEELESILDALVAAEFLYPQALSPERTYAFKHPLTQEVSYNSQLSERRAGVHAEVARAIAELYPERADEQAALVAEHWERAGDKREAARWHARAAAWAGTNDPAAALQHWRRVHEVVQTLPEDDETAALSLASCIWVLQFGWRLGMPAEEADSLFEEAEALARRRGDLRSRASLLTVYATIKAIPAEITVEEYVAKTLEAISLAEEAGDHGLFVGLTIAPAFALFNAGRYRESMELCERAIDYAKDDPTMGTGISVTCPYGWCVMFKGLCLSYIGDLDEAERWIDRGMEVSRANGDMETVGWSYEMRTWLHFLRGDGDRALADGQQALEIAERIGDAFSRTWARMWMGYGHRTRLEYAEAIEAIEESEAMSKELRTAILGRTPRLATLADCYVELGNPAPAVALAREALEVAAHQGHRSALPYARCMLAKALSRTEGVAARDEIEALFEKAIADHHETGFRNGLPLALLERAQAAGALGNEEAMQSGLREALRAFEEIGAHGYAARIAQQLELQPS